MSKLSFRAKALDPNKPMPVYVGNEVPDLLDFAVVNRTVPEMPTGMEKEEETEHHLQRALSAQQAFGTAQNRVIPIPEMVVVEERYKKLYCSNCTFKLSKQYIHEQPWGFDQEIPEYNMDSEDEIWLEKQANNLKMDVKPIKFENMMDRLEKGSGQMVVTLPEAKALIKEDDDLIIAFYDYWLNKRLRLQQTLIPQVKTEKRDGTSTNNPYVAFRRRAERMQTRKNRKNDETSYEKILRLKKDLNRALLIIESLKRREKSKKELLKLTIEIVEKRFKMQDWSGKLLEEAEAKKDTISTLIPLPQTFATIRKEWTPSSVKDENANVRKKREYKKRKHKPPSSSQVEQSMMQVATSTFKMSRFLGMGRSAPSFSSDDDEGILSGSALSDHESDPDGEFAFKRKADCVYYAPCLTNGQGCCWPWESREAGGSAESRFRYSLTSLDRPRTCVGFTRQRLGRGGRVIYDRAFTPWDKGLKRPHSSQPDSSPDPIERFRLHNIPHYRPIIVNKQNNEEAFVSRGLSSDVSVVEDVNVDSCDTPVASYEFNPNNDVSVLDTEVFENFAVTPLHGTTNRVMSNQSISNCASVSVVLNGFKGDSLPDRSSPKIGGLSTMPADNILQLNYPMNGSVSVASTISSASAASKMAGNSFVCNGNQSFKSLIPASNNSSQLARNMNGGGDTVTNIASSGVCPKVKLAAAINSQNHIDAPSIIANIVNNASGILGNSSGSSLLVPVLKLAIGGTNGGTNGRNDSKQIDPHKTLNHMSNDSVVAMEVT